MKKRTVNERHKDHVEQLGKVPHVRKGDWNILPPPAYENKNQISVRFYVGGRLLKDGNTAAYLGGKFYVADFVDMVTVKMVDLEMFTHEMGCEGIRNYYMLKTNKSFKLINNDTDLRSGLRNYKHLARVYVSEFQHNKDWDPHEDLSCYNICPSEDIHAAIRRIIKRDSTMRFWVEEWMQVAVRVVETEPVIYKVKQADIEDLLDDGVVDDAAGESNDIPTTKTEVEDSDSEDYFADWDAVWTEVLVEYAADELSNSGLDDNDLKDLIDDEIGLLDSDDERGYRRAEEDDKVWPEFDMIDVWNPKFELGLKFPSKKILREAVHSHAILVLRNLKITVNDKKRMYVRCLGLNCEWMLHANRVLDEETFQINEFHGDHGEDCAKVPENRSVKSTWLAKRFEALFKSDPTRNTSGFREDAAHFIKAKVTIHQARRAKRLALKNLFGDPYEQFAQLWDYGNELKKQNPSSTIIIKQSEDTDEQGRHRFDRMYVCFNQLIDGFTGCRPLIGVDGTFLRGSFDSIFLVAMGFDGNNQLFPIAYGLVHTESINSWTWFLELLRNDLNVTNEFYYTFISDKQKGLLNAFKQVFPGATNRFCVRHLLGNLKKKGHSGVDVEDAVWAAAKATTLPEFDEKYNALISMNAAFPGWFAKRPGKHWSRAFQDPHSKCDTLLNNVCESFNSAIKEARAFPVVQLLEWVRRYIMTKLTYNREFARRKWIGLKVCPNIRRILDKRFDFAAKCDAHKSDDNLFEVDSPRQGTDKGTTYIVNLVDMTCTCRRYQLQGIPCIHALCAIHFDGLDPTNYCSEYYTVQRYLSVYNKSKVLPINGADLWEKTNKAGLIPPLFFKKKGRKGNKIRRDDPYEEEAKRNSRRLPRQRGKVKCSKCQQEGHNKTTCKNPAVVEPEPVNEEPQVPQQPQPVHEEQVAHPPEPMIVDEPPAEDFIPATAPITEKGPKKPKKLRRVSQLFVAAATVTTDNGASTSNQEQPGKRKINRKPSNKASKQPGKNKPFKQPGKHK